MLLLILILIFVNPFFTIYTHAKCESDVYVTIPKGAKKYMPLVVNYNIRYLHDYIIPSYFASLIEHETCVTLCSKKCWNPKARFKTKREEGGGLSQLTRVFYKNGMVKWDILRNLKIKYKKELKELTWDNLYDRPDLQIKALILMWKNNYNYYKDKVKRSELKWFADSAYNGGYKYLNRERRLCKLTPNCNPKIWFDNVEKIKSARAKRKLYGNRTAWDINRYHVRDVKRRITKYIFYLGKGLFDSP